MHIIKLVYIAHGWNLGFARKALILEATEAWRYGPVIPVVYRKFKSFGGDPIEIELKNQSEKLSPHQNLMLDFINDAYEDYDALQLSTMTHEEGTPWHTTYHGAGPGAIIPNKLIEAHYIEKIEDLISDAP
jgi:uncharacterized phage-associated protein